MISRKVLFFVFVLVFFEISLTLASECKTEIKTIEFTNEIADDNQRYIIINIPGFVQKAKIIECLSDQSCEKGSCRQDYKLHQFLSLPHGKQTFQSDDLKLRFFKLPYGCKCGD